MEELKIQNQIVRFMQSRLFLLNLFLPTAESMPESCYKAGDDATLQHGSTAGSLRGPQGWDGEAPVLPWLWHLLQDGMEKKRHISTLHTRGPSFRTFQVLPIPE